MKIKIVEKKNHLAVHGLFDSVARAEKHLKEVIPQYVSKGYFMDKTLTANDFEILVEGISGAVDCARVRAA